jgi:hypothetical protein
MFYSIRVLSWARFVGLVWYTRLFFSEPNQSLQSYEPTCVLRVQKELDRGAPKHSLCSYHTITISVICTHGNRDSHGYYLTTAVVLYNNIVVACSSCLALGVYVVYCLNLRPDYETASSKLSNDDVNIYVTDKGAS